MSDHINSSIVVIIMQFLSRLSLTALLILGLHLCFTPIQSHECVNEFSLRKHELKEYLLPNDHPLQSALKNIFNDSNMFESPSHWHLAGFQVLDRVHRNLMVARHPSIKNYLFKKFSNPISQKDQVNNYLKRISGARSLRTFIAKNRLQHITVPKKWLYQLPKKFNDSKTKEKTYILIVEEMDICSGGADPFGEVAQRYYHIEDEVLRELCIVLYHFRGLDSMLHNMPFTYQNKIAFIDTEKWKIKRKGYLRNAMQFLSPEKQAYALAIFQELENQNQ